MELMSLVSAPPCSAPATAAPAPGDTLGRYLLLNMLHTGDAACVFLAHDPMLDRSVAIKLQAPAAARDPEAFERFRHAAQALARAPHPSIVTLYEWLETPHGPALVLEYVVGRSLAQWLSERGRLSAAEVATLFDPVLVALEQLHRVGVTHANLTPEHIFITTDRRIKLLGFGGARITGDHPGSQVADDLHGLGASLYAALLGRPLNVDETPSEMKDVAPALQQLLARAAAPDPKRRFQSARALRQALAQAAAEVPGNGWRGRLRRWRPSHFMRGRALRLDLLLILAFATLVLGLGLYPRERPLADSQVQKKSVRPERAAPPENNRAKPAPAPQAPHDRYRDLRQAWEA